MARRTNPDEQSPSCYALFQPIMTHLVILVLVLIMDSYLELGVL